MPAELKTAPKSFIKQLRQNSKKYRKSVIEKAIFRCEVCNWSPPTLVQCLQVHHICPVEVYSKIFFTFKDALDSRFQNGMPNEEFEKANQIVLCPNCHAMVHKIQRSKNRVGDLYDDVERYVLQSFLDYANAGIYDHKKVSTLKDVASGSMLRTRLGHNYIF